MRRPWSLLVGIGGAACLVAICALSAPESGAQGGATPEYIGVKGCKKCHFKQWKTWKETKMAKAFDLLKPGQGGEAKTKKGLDPAKDYTRDETCLPCHVVGYGKPGGYRIPAAGDAKAAEEASQLEGIQCESCHGPGGIYTPIMKEKDGDKNPPYKLAEVTAVGLVLPNADNCKECHNEKSPFVDPNATFDFEKKKDEGTHEHTALKFKH